jgi:DNA-binding MarR family transcriptional regulator
MNRSSDSKKKEPRDPREPREAARFAYAGLDRLIHERSRLSILTSLASHPQGLVFNDLKMLCALTDGNLSRQVTQLNEAGLVEVWKGQRNRRPQTLVRLTPRGRKRFAEYLSVLESVLSDAAQTGSQAADDEESEPRGRGLSTT